MGQVLQVRRGASVQRPPDVLPLERQECRVGAARLEPTEGPRAGAVLREALAGHLDREVQPVLSEVPVVRRRRVERQVPKVEWGVRRADEEQRRPRAEPRERRGVWARQAPLERRRPEEPQVLRVRRPPRARQARRWVWRGLRSAAVHRVLRRAQSAVSVRRGSASEHQLLAGRKVLADLRVRVQARRPGQPGRRYQALQRAARRQALVAVRRRPSAESRE